jgi:hypothetical protein
MAKIVKHQIPESDLDYWGSDFITIWSAPFGIHANNLEKRLEYDKQVTPADFAKEIRNEFRKLYGNVRFKQMTRASSFAAEFNNQPASMAQPDELLIQKPDGNKIPYRGRKRASSGDSQSSDPPKAKRNKTANNSQTCEGYKGSHILENCFLFSDPNNP